MGASEVLFRSHCRRSGWSWPLHPFQFIAWFFLLYFLLVHTLVLTPACLPHWQPACYVVSFVKSFIGSSFVLCSFSCLHLSTRPVAYLMTRSDWLKSCQAWLDVLVTVSEQGANIGCRLYISFIKWLDSAACILSVVKRIQLEFWYDMLTGVIFLDAKFRSDMTRNCSFVVRAGASTSRVYTRFAQNDKLEYTKNIVLEYWFSSTCTRMFSTRPSPGCGQVKICEFTKNKQEVSQYFHLHAWAPPAAVYGWVDERIQIHRHKCHLKQVEAQLDSRAGYQFGASYGFGVMCLWKPGCKTVATKLENLLTKLAF